MKSPYVGVQSSVEFESVLLTLQCQVMENFLEFYGWMKAFVSDCSGFVLVDMRSLESSSNSSGSTDSHFAGL